jgi:hypothetical protein
MLISVADPDSLKPDPVFQVNPDPDLGALVTIGFDMWGANASQDLIVTRGIRTLFNKSFC